MNEVLKKSLRLYLRCLVGSIMCCVLMFTFKVIGTGVFTHDVGYTMYGTLEGGEQTELYTHYYEDGDDLKEQEFVDKGYSLQEITIRSEMDKTTFVWWEIFSQVCLIFMMGVFVYNELWNLGYKDNNAVRIGTKREDKLKGIKIGLITMIPSFILLTVLVIGKASYASNFSIAAYGFLNTHLYDAIILLSPGSDGGTFSELSALSILAYYGLLLIIPIIAHIAYILGYKSILVSERLVYKKK